MINGIIYTDHKLQIIARVHFSEYCLHVLLYAHMHNVYEKYKAHLHYVSQNIKRKLFIKTNVFYDI